MRFRIDYNDSGKPKRLVLMDAGNCEASFTPDHPDFQARLAESGLKFVDVSVVPRQPTAKELAERESLQAAVQILKNDVPEAWKDSVNAQQRIAWALKRLFIEGRAELKGGA